MDITPTMVLEEVLKISEHYEEVTAIYAIDIEHTKMQYKIISESHKKKSFLKYLKKMLHILRDDDFETMIVDLSERIGCKKLDNNNVVIVVADKERMTHGKLFALLKSIKIESIV